MKDEKRLLEVGDAIIMIQYGKPYERYVIKRVTKTMAFTADNRDRFKREISDNGHITRPSVDRHTWYSNTYSLATKELNDALDRIVLLNKCRSLSLDHLSFDDLKKIYDIAKKGLEKTK